MGRRRRNDAAAPIGKGAALHATRYALLLGLMAALAGCVDSSGRSDGNATAETCMTCHNGSQHDDYRGPGLENPHPFPGASNLRCTECHGGNPNGKDALAAHVPPPPEIGDREQWERDPLAYFNRLTLTGIDKFPDYEANGLTYSAIDYLQFINPGDLRVTELGRSCGRCHQAHSATVANSMLATETGVFSGASYAIGVDNAVPENAGLDEDTTADLAFRAVTDLTFDSMARDIGTVQRLMEFPVFSGRDDEGPLAIRNNPEYDAENLPQHLNADNSCVTDSPLANLFHEQVAFTCGDCHLGSAGANNRYGDFRSSGCTACHMPYSLSGRSTTGDPNVNRLEPADPDDIDEPELPHPKRHLITSVAQTLPSGETVQGIDDYACAGCHQGSNRTVMQYWGIRLDQNQDVRRGVQYPAQPEDYRTTSGDPRLFDPEIGNNTFNGRNRNQYLLFEDYDGDGRDDTPPDIHYEAGMGCIDCHGSYDLHGGNVLANATDIHSRMGQSVAIRCESCHGGVDSYAPTAPGLDWNGQAAELAMDAKGNALDHVYRDAEGNYYLRSRLTGNRHYIKQTLDTIVDTGRIHPFTGEPVYSEKASFAMGYDDGNPATGIGPQQENTGANGFCHSTSAGVSCVSCHASWTNTCTGCHLEGEYNNGNNFSNITGERIVFREREADFVYQSPVPFQLGVGPDNEIDPISPNTKAFFTWRDRRGNFSDTFAFTDRNGGGNNPARSPAPALGHNVMMPHSIRGKVSPANEGPRYCTACHLTENSLSQFGADYEAFRAAMASGDYGALDFELLREHIGKNPNNQLDSPLWVHMVAGLGSGLFLFDEDGCPTNPLDQDDDRKGCDNGAPADNFDPANVAFNLDRLVDGTGLEQGSSNHPMLDPFGPNDKRQGAANPGLSGPLGVRQLLRLADPNFGIVLDSWIDADGIGRGNAPDFGDDGGGSPPSRRLPDPETKRPDARKPDDEEPIEPTPERE